MGRPDLHKVFYGMNYTPRNAQYPECGVTQKDVTLDVALLSQLTDRIRIYGTDCNQGALILNAFQDLGLTNMSLSLGIWIDKSHESSIRQLTEMEHLLSKYPLHYFNSILVGNEVLFRGDLSTGELIRYIDYVQDYLRYINAGHIPVGTSEIGSKWTPELAKHVDIMAANIHPFFGGVHVSISAKWTYDFLLQQVVPHIHPENATSIISEVGWPSGGGHIQGSVAGLSELQSFLDSWICDPLDSTHKDIGWYWFEAIDQPWKERWNTPDSQWETQWGLFNADRELKNITIPTCTLQRRAKEKN
ncbi:Cell wall endo-beta-1,3-glucanase [Sugiyamaella lignohabitans]|uniref:glucan endo-1,3-beta-D-glucosidase n=1 Tax=Sugiyamaella lignohabitans TaxID=796027 RepID=A0A167F5V8_9ASCO|nr:Cell wall endo-beta-1,3-glucanase [Sugiyamaella lignohabitans]ANB14872.1 Cell wall endo-beta-1,3-glucanase [Sugiyamaella lignohabitans]